MPARYAAVAALIVLAGLIGWAVTNRGDGGAAEIDVPAPAAPRTTDPCSLWTTGELEAWLGGSPWERADIGNDGLERSCHYREVDGPGLVSVTVAETPTVWQFEALHARSESAPVSDLGDEAWWWEDRSLPGGGLVVRVEGRAASVTLGGQFDDRLAYAAAGRTPPDPDNGGAEPADDPIPALADQEISVMVYERLMSLGSAVADRLEPAPFEESDPNEANGSRGATICQAIALDVLSVELGEPAEGASLAPLGENGCAFATVTGVNVTFELVGQGVDVTALAVERESAVDGETVRWEGEAIGGLGDGAIWMADPLSGTTGDLHVLYGSALVRIVSSGPSPEGIRERAVAAAEAVGPTVAALAEEG